jgi:tetratricopeptide (TPR) repeat protein
VHPEPLILKVLLALAKRDGDVVTKDEFNEEVWDGRAFGDEPLLRAISLLRGHFEDTRPYQYIDTLHRRGYRLLQRVELHTGAETTDVRDVAAAPDTRLWKTIAAIVAAGFLAIGAYTWTQMSGEPEPRSIAILEIENLTGDPGLQYAVEGIKNSLAPRLSEIPNFTIKNIILPYDEEMPEVARRFKVEYLLTGYVQLQGNTLKISYHITRGDNGGTVGGGDVVGSVDTLFTMQEQLAKKVRDDLDGGASPQLITRRQPDSAAYNSYMRGMYMLELRFDRDNLAKAIELFKEAIRLDERYGPAYLALASAYSLAHDYYDAPFEEMNELALATIEQGVAKDASIADAAWAIHGRVYHQQHEWKKSEAAYLRAINAQVVDSNAFSWYSRMLASTGRLAKARDIVLAAETIDPDNAMVNSRIAMAQTWFGDDAAAEEYFRRSNDLGATGPIHIMSQALLLWRTNRADESRELTVAAMGISGRPTFWVEPVYAALADPTDASKRDAALASIDNAWTDQLIIPEIVLIVRSLLHDLDGAMAVAELLEAEGEAFSTELIFIPEIAALRRHPGFMPLLERLGIVAYWDELGCTWDGDRVHCPTN